MEVNLLSVILIIILMVSVGLILKSGINILYNKWYYGTNSYIDIDRWRLMNGGINDFK